MFQESPKSPKTPKRRLQDMILKDLGGPTGSTDLGGPTGSMLVGTMIASTSTSCQKMRKALRYWKSYYFFNIITFPGGKKTIKNRSKIIPKLKSRWEGLLTRTFSPFCMVFRPQDGPDIPKMAPQRRQNGSQDVAKTPPRPPRSSQDPSKTVHDAFKTAQDEPKTLQEAFKSRQDPQNDPKMTLQAFQT